MGLPIRRRLFVAFALAGSISAVVDARHPRPGPHWLECELLEPLTVRLSWDTLGISPEFHEATLLRDELEIATLDPESRTFIDDLAPAGRHAYEILILPLREEVDPFIAASCEIEVSAVFCQVFGGVAQPPQVDISWVLPRPGSSEVQVFRGDELEATLSGGTVAYFTEPFGGPEVFRVEAIYEDETVVVGSCEIDFRPPVIGGLQRGDCTGEGEHDISDAVCMLGFLFLGTRVGCEKTADVDDNGVVELTDAVFYLNHLFRGGPPPADPFPGCGHDPTTDELSCHEHAPCFTPPPP